MGAGLLAVSVAYAIVAWRYVVRRPVLPMVDLDVYRQAGEDVLAGRPVYSGRERGLVFTYPPFAALAAVAVTPLGRWSGQLVWSLATAGATAGVVWLSFRAALDRAGRWWPAALGALTAGALVTHPLVEHVFFGQVNVFLVLACLLDAAAARICELEGADRYRAPFVLEGGAVHTDGEGTVLVTEECLLDPHRNPGWTRAAAEEALGRYLGAERVIWLGRGVVDDETRGHVDNLACFVRPGVVALTWTEDREDPQYAISLDARRRLEAATDARGRTLEVHLLHQPGPLYRSAEEAAGLVPSVSAVPRRAGERLAGSYVNSYVATGRVVVPLLDDDALGAFEAWFPGREVVGVPAREILLGGGGIHCITQQVPRRRVPEAGG